MIKKSVGTKIETKINLGLFLIGQVVCKHKSEWVVLLSNFPLSTPPGIISTCLLLHYLSDPPFLSSF
uniref:Ovule protein n=1 Tax=Meloidogyne incognita TaxID=6306 RepID=A0A914KJA7_MELIC